MAQTRAVALPDFAGRINNFFGASSLAEIGVPLAVLLIITALIAPMPSFVLDGLLVVNIMMSLTVLMVSIHVTKPVEFSVYPTTLLLLTLFRLALNVSSSRLILMNGDTGTQAAGSVIEAFGNFVVGGNYIIGAVIFLVLLAIQFVVINHGAVRISEVTARFTLDALPGKQMSIDADLNAGLIDEEEAKSRRKALAAETEFFGAMDGATRFTQRDAIASILITGINIIAGFLIGILQHDMDLMAALQTYTVLTIGDGLVTVIPALMISISGGLVVTRASSGDKLSVDFKRQIFEKPQPLLLASGILIAMAAFPGLPKIPFLLMGGGLGTMAWRMRQKTVEADKQLTQKAKQAALPAAQQDNLETLLKVEPLAVEVGLGLVKLVEGGPNSPLLRRISGIRRQLASELGYLLPPVRVMDNLGLRANEYVISIKGVEVSRYELREGFDLAIPVDKVTVQIEGEKTLEPAFGLNALWIPRSTGETARNHGYTVVDSINVLGTHLAELIKRHAHELFSRQDTKTLLDRIAVDAPKVVEDLVPKLLSMAVVQRILQNLLRERVSIRDGVSILEAMGEAAGTTQNATLLTEYVRQSIRRSLVQPYLNRSGELYAYFLDPAIEQAVEQAVEHRDQYSHLAMAPQQIRGLVDRIERKVGKPEAPAIAISSAGSRFFLRQMVEASVPNLFFVSHNEVPSGVRVVSLGVIQ